MWHFGQEELPFGGVGASGMGAYHGEYGFRTFSKHKGVMMMNSLLGQLIARFLKPPYTDWTDRIISFLLGRPPKQAGRFLGQARARARHWSRASVTGRSRGCRGGTLNQAM